MLKQKLMKFISELTLIVMISSITTPVFANSIVEQNDSTNNDNVKFDVTIQNGHSYTAQINEENALDLSLEVLNDGYVKNASITFEDTNYTLGEVSNENVLLNEENAITLNSIESGNKVELKVPIKFEKNDKVSKNYFNKDSRVTLKAIYVNENGNEIPVTKNITEHIEWQQTVKETIKQEVIRYLKYEDKTLISFLVTDGIENNELPTVSKNIEISVPKINEMEPDKIIVTGDDISYKYENQTLKIVKTNNEDTEGKISWDSQSKMMVTYVYNTQVDNAVFETNAIAVAQLANNIEITGKTEQTSFTLNEETGSIVETQISGTESISKGYLYSNLNKTENKIDTTFDSTYTVNVGYSELLDSILIKEFEATSDVIDTKVEVSSDELKKILGDEGYIKIHDSKDLEIATINKDNLTAEINAYGLRFETSKPISEGNISIKTTKMINPNLTYTKKSISRVNSIDNDVRAIGIYKGNEISNNVVKKEILLTEPESKASIAISQDSLSAISKNEDVVITATLNTNNVNTALYKDPELRITLPSQVKNINLKDAQLVYDDELTPNIFETKDNVIIIKLKGTQTKYSNLPTTEGSVVRIVADLTVDNLAVSSEENIVLEYANEETGEVKNNTIPVKIVSKSPFITVNSLNYKGNTISSLDRENNIEISNKGNQIIELGGTVICNAEESVKNAKIIGRIPMKDISEVTDSNISLNSNFDSHIENGINVNGANATVYYSSKGNATTDLNNTENAWTTEYSDSSKSYLISINNELIKGNRIDFGYKINVQNALNNQSQSISSYGVSYLNENNVESINKAENINILAEQVPVIVSNLTAINSNTNEQIQNNDFVPNGSKIKYILNIKNDSKKEANNLLVNIKIPTNCGYIGENGEAVFDKESLLSEIDRIEGYEEKTIEFILEMPEETTTENEIKITSTVSGSDFYDSNSEMTNSLKQEHINALLYVQNNEYKYVQGEEVQYFLRLKKGQDDDLKNVNIEIKIPDNMKPTKYDGASYDENSKKLTFHMETLQYDTLHFTLEIESLSEFAEQIKLNAKVTSDSFEGEEYSNNCIVKTKNVIGIEANVSSKIEDKNIEYTITVSNNTVHDANISVYDILDPNCELINYTIKNGSNVSSYSNTYAIGNEEIVKPGDQIILTVNAKIMIGSDFNDVNINNRPLVSVEKVNVNVNEVNDKLTNTIVEILEYGKHLIKGYVWYDSNNNALKDSNETTVKDVYLTLYNQSNGEIVKDENGNDITCKPNDEGYYSFNNVSNGNYVIIAKYNTNTYEVVNYNNDNKLESNSKFVEGIFNNEKIANTDVIFVENSDISNLNLGLKDKKVFEVTIDSYIKKVSVVDGEKQKTFDESTNQSIVKITKDELKKSIIICEYEVIISNIGNTDGIVKSIIDKIPDNMEFNAELNPEWFINKDGYAENTSVGNTSIKAGESITKNIVLISNSKEDIVGINHNVIEVKNTYNEMGIKTTNAKSSLITYADSIVKIDNSPIAVQTSIISLGIISIIVIALVVIKKKVIQ